MEGQLYWLIDWHKRFSERRRETHRWTDRQTNWQIDDLADRKTDGHKRETSIVCLWTFLLFCVSVCNIANQKCATTVVPIEACTQTIRGRFYPGQGSSSVSFIYTLGIIWLPMTTPLPFPLNLKINDDSNCWILHACTCSCAWKRNCYESGYFLYYVYIQYVY